MQQNLDRMKCRALNDTTKKLVYGCGYRIVSNMVILFDEDGREVKIDHGHCMLRDLHFSTGLKDKNGKLIFEGDVLKVPKEYNFGNIQKVIITWQDGCFGFQSVGFSEFRTDSEIELFEVIGNIFENKELLTEK